MDEPVHRTIETNGISMHVAEQGQGRPVFLCHGFPELWYSWRHQLPALAAGGYRAIAPDQRGYGRTDRPADVAEYDILHLTADLLGLLGAMGEERAVFVGHDWGAMVVWALSVLAPERVEAVAAMSVPFLPHAPAPPTQLLRARFGDRFMYILYFQQVGPADDELGRDPRRTLSSVLWSASGDAPPDTIRRLPRGAGWLDGMSDPPELPPWLTDDELRYYAAEFERTGFTGGLNWYRNLDRNWELTQHLRDAKVGVPAVFIAGERDPFLRMTPPSVMDGRVPHLRGTHLVPGAGHWVQQERPGDVNRILLEFLEGP